MKMSLLYKMFGVPRTFDEFLDKERRTGSNSIDLVVKRHPENPGDLSWDELHTEIYARGGSGRRRSLTNLQIYPFQDSSEHVDLVGQCLAFRKEAAERKGFCVGVVGFKGELPRYDPQRARDLSERYIEMNRPGGWEI